LELTFTPICKNIDISQFSCSENELNEYLKKYALSNHINRISTCILVKAEMALVGFFCWSNCAVDKASIDPQDAKGLPRYPLPAIKIGRLAVDYKYTGKGLGGSILKHIFEKAILYSKKEEYPAFSFLLVDAKTEKARQWYISYGFKSFSDKTESLYLPIKTLLKASMVGLA
jgi:GNAT superfamily N-acetyltransferase